MSRPFRPSRRRFLLPLGAAGLGALTTFALPWWVHLRMPGSSPTEPSSPTDEELRWAERLRGDVGWLAGEIGERNMCRRPAALRNAADWIDKRLERAGYDPLRQIYRVDGQNAANIEATKPGRKTGLLVVGAHYDTVVGSPGANDNGSGVVVLLALAEMLRLIPSPWSLRFVFFTNEEPPYFRTENMGSIQYARQIGIKDQLVGMISLDTIGYYNEKPGSQHLPFPLGLFYPNRGDFIAFVGKTDAGPFVRSLLKMFRHTTPMPSEGACPPPSVQGVSWSDHASFWPLGIPTALVTDTALMRYPHYHRPSDTADKIDYHRLARLTCGLARVLSEFA